MQIGFNIPVSGPLATPDNVVRLAAEGESMGFDYATFSDHVLMPKDVRARYPYTDAGEFPSGSLSNWFEQLSLMGFLAGKTSRLRLLSSVMVVPYRPAVLTAKIIATLDALSAGRVSLGVGAGWMREEFEALDAPPFEHRGTVTDEYLAAFRELWTKDAPHFEGRFVKFSNIDFYPKPVQNPLPIWVGGESRPAMRRAARIGDGWYPIGVNPQQRLDSLARLRAGMERMRGMVREAGRDLGAFGFGYRVQAFGESLPDKADDGERRLFSGSAEDIAGDLRSFRELGVRQVDFSYAAGSREDTLARMRRFRDGVVARL
jgi:probable F420-dependent oxidoreductase